MRIAFIVNRFPALSETFILNQITGLLDRGHEVDIYAYRRRNEPEIHADVKKYNLLKRTYYLTFYASQSTNRVNRLLGSLGQIVSALRRKRISPLSSLNLLKYWSDATSRKILYQIIAFLDKAPYDIVHCQFGPIGNLGTILKEVGVMHGEIVTTFRGYDISMYIEKKGVHVYDMLFEKGDLFLCVSNQIKDMLIKLGCEDRKIVVHRSGVQLTNFHSHLPKSRSDGQVRLLTIARLVEKKGVEYGIQAVSKVLKNHPNLEYKIAGDGYLRNDLQILIEELEVVNNVKLLGWQHQEQIIDLLQEADILLAPSVTSQTGDREGIPGAIVEALAWGLPVLSTRHSGIPEVVQDGECGFLVPERDTEALAEKLEYMLAHPELWREMGRKGRMYVEEHYDLDKLNDRLVEIYQQILAGKLLTA